MGTDFTGVGTVKDRELDVIKRSHVEFKSKRQKG